VHGVDPERCSRPGLSLSAHRRQGLRS
jgi:hypothetical protein